MRHLAAVGRGGLQGRVVAVLGGPVGHKGLEVLDVEGLIQFPPHADPLAGVGADEAADPGEGVVLPDHFQGFHEAALGHQGHVAGNVDARGAGRLAGRQQQLVAHPGRTMLVVRVHPVFFREVLQRGENGVHGLTSQMAGAL